LQGARLFRAIELEVVAMRHLVGLVLALAAAAAVFFGGGWAVYRIMAAHAHGTSLVGMSGGLTLAALLGTGLYLGLLVAVPAISPVAAGLPGLILLAWSGLDVFKTHWALRLIPLSAYQEGYGFQTMLTIGVLALLGIMLIVPIFIPSRWRWREPVDEFAGLAHTEFVH
jgi:hypothetical protein